MVDNDQKDTDGQNLEETADAAPVEDSDAEADEELSFVEDPAFEVDYKGDCAYEVKVSIPPANRRSEADKMFDELKHEAEVPGFRRGRAPRKLIERKFSKAVRGEVEGKLVNAAFQKLIKDNDFKPINMPDIEGLDDAEERADDEALSFTLKFEVSPRIELGKYRGIEVERPIVTVDEGDLDQAIDDLRARYAVFETIQDGKADEGDQVIMDFKGLVDGQEFPGGSATAYPYILGTQRFFAEFEEALKGASSGDDLTCTVTLPEQNPNEDLRGKQADFTIHVREIKRRNLPELDDEFAGRAGYENVADLRQKVGDQLRAGSEAQSNRIAEARALAEVVESSTYEIPKTLIDGVAEDLYQDEVRRMLQMRVPIAQIEENEDELRKRAQDGALDEIKRLVTLNEICEAEGVEVTDADFEQEVESIASRTGVGADAVSSYLEEGGRRSSYESRIARSKAMQIIMENASVTDKEVPRDELDDENASEDRDDE
ncbi:MAG: trigger factor [Candidatus Hydrogenedentes bacterium]|nr:trigger factor [Candidatus Hydrogenedentota bacterium]